MASIQGDIRKCLVRKWSDFNGYGFNLHAEKGKAGQYVGKVDEGSPAEAAGLKDGDRIVEVNDVNIGNENHQQVVTRIKAGGDQVTLLVVDKAADDYCKNNKIVISHELPEVKSIDCPATSSVAAQSETTAQTDEPAPTEDAPVDNDYEAPVTADESSPPPAPADVEERKENTVNDEAGEDNLPQTEELPPPPPALTEIDDVLEADAKGSEEAAAAVQPELDPEPEPKQPKPKQAEPEEPKSEPEPPKPAPAQNGDSSAKPEPSVDTMHKMTAAEMREALSKKKKADPRKEKISAKAKLDMFQRL